VYETKSYTNKLYAIVLDDGNALAVTLTYGQKIGFALLW